MLEELLYSIIEIAFFIALPLWVGSRYHNSKFQN
jgi:hypothetical protein